MESSKGTKLTHCDPFERGSGKPRALRFRSHRFGAMLSPFRRTMNRYHLSSLVFLVRVSVSRGAFEDFSETSC